MYPGNGGWDGRYDRYPEAPPRGFKYPTQPGPLNFADLHNNDANTTWREIYDPKRDRLYYWNSITKTAQWERPSGVAIKPQPPPPSSPPPLRVKVNTPEHEQWKHIKNDKARGKYWYNTVTKKDQFYRPECCKKYK